MSPAKILGSLALGALVMLGLFQLGMELLFRTVLVAPTPETTQAPSEETLCREAVRNLPGQVVGIVSRDGEWRGTAKVHLAGGEQRHVPFSCRVEAGEPDVTIDAPTGFRLMDEDEQRAWRAREERALAVRLANWCDDAPRGEVLAHCRTAIKQRLAAPLTATFRQPEVQRDGHSGRYTATYEVNYRNLYNVPLRQSFACTICYRGNQIDSLEVSP